MEFSINVRVFLTILNILIMLAFGFLMIFVNLKSTNTGYDYFMGYENISIDRTIFITGILVIIIDLLGIFCLWCFPKHVLLIYAILNVILLIVTLLCLVAVKAYGRSISNDLEPNMESEWKIFIHRNGSKFDELSELFECCGTTKELKGVLPDQLNQRLPSTHICRIDGTQACVFIVEDRIRLMLEPLYLTLYIAPIGFFVVTCMTCLIMCYVSKRMGVKNPKRPSTWLKPHQGGSVTSVSSLFGPAPKKENNKPAVKEKHLYSE